MKFLISLLFFIQIAFGEVFIIQHNNINKAHEIKKYIEKKYHIPSKWFELKKTENCHQTDRNFYMNICVESNNVSILEYNKKRLRTLKILRVQ